MSTILNASSIRVSAAMGGYVATLRDADPLAGIQYRYHITHRANRGAA